MGFGQVLTDVFYVWQNMDNNYTKMDHNLIDYKQGLRDYYLTVPDGKLWKIMQVESFRTDDDNYMYYYGNNVGERNADIYLYDEAVRGSTPQTVSYTHLTLPTKA